MVQSRSLRVILFLTSVLRQLQELLEWYRETLTDEDYIANPDTNMALPLRTVPRSCQTFATDAEHQQGVSLASAGSPFASPPRVVARSGKSFGVL